MYKIVFQNKGNKVKEKKRINEIRKEICCFVYMCVCVSLCVCVYLRESIDLQIYIHTHKVLAYV